MDVKKFREDIQSIPEKMWKERTRNATPEEMRWIAEALPTSVLEEELRNRSTFLASTISEYLKLSIKVNKEEKRRLGVF